MITGLAVPVLGAVATHVLDSSLKGLTGLIAGERYSGYTVHSDQDIFVTETLLVFIIPMGDRGSQ